MGSAILISECNYEYLEYHYVKKSLVLGSLPGSMILGPQGVGCLTQSGVNYLSLTVYYV